MILSRVELRSLDPMTVVRFVCLPLSLSLPPVWHSIALSNYPLRATIVHNVCPKADCSNEEPCTANDFNSHDLESW